MKENIPNHLAIIMDGNGRWATSKGLSRSMGHLQGFKTLIKMTEVIFKREIKILSIFAFSTENFKRSKEEVDYIMNLFVTKFKSQLKKLIKNNIRVIFSGKKEGLPSEVLDAMKEMTEKTKDNKYIFNMCINYGGQSEIIDAIKKIINSNVDINMIDTNTFKQYLYNELPDIDLLIRTSGEMRISNFMIYQLAYSEFFFTNTLWPDFSEKDLNEAINSFNKRERRYGGTK